MLKNSCEELNRKAACGCFICYPVQINLWWVQTWRGIRDWQRNLTGGRITSRYIMHWLSWSHSPFFSTLVLCRMVWQKEVVKTIYKFWNKLRFISIAKISSWGICCPWGTYLIIRAWEGHFYLQVVPSYACSKCGPPLFGCCYRYFPHYMSGVKFLKIRIKLNSCLMIGNAGGRKK